jgi:cellulose synthase/poly-beta-1,6-N-acetylglucosamine synthase-like glycosyltransferase
MQLSSGSPRKVAPVTKPGLFGFYGKAGWRVFFENRLRTLLQTGLSFAFSFGLPLIIFVALARLGFDISIAVYYLVVISLLVTAYLIWVEGFWALPLINPPEIGLDESFPPASAIIAAYLPNEAATIVETVEAFLRLDYPGPLQIILAYNTPRPLPVEERLEEIARFDTRFVPLRVEESTSKAQNVNAALAHVSGEFVGVFDADHHPDPDSFRRAWRWLSPAGGYNVVQGHCLVRNGHESWVARLVAVEFEGIYAVSHPGRARLHRFGIFGGSNGYWKTSLLHRTRMHGFMLTEDIDSSLRVTEAGYKIASDPLLVSRELAPVNLKALWNQRMRWAQGWFQVSLRHCWQGMRSPNLSIRQKLGFFQLLAWREFYPWLSSQILPIIVFLGWKEGGFDRLNWLVPVFVLTTIFVVGTGPWQVMFAYLLAEPQVRRHKGWFWFYLVMSLLFYTGFKNLIARVAQIKEFMQERQWKVTPRAATQNHVEGEAHAPQVSA